LLLSVASSCMEPLRFHWLLHTRRSRIAHVAPP
jgi:hypothetical protein